MSFSDGWKKAGDVAALPPPPLHFPLCAVILEKMKNSYLGHLYHLQIFSILQMFMNSPVAL